MNVRTFRYKIKNGSVKLLGLIILYDTRLNLRHFCFKIENESVLVSHFSHQLLSSILRNPVQFVIVHFHFTYIFSTRIPVMFTDLANDHWSCLTFAP